ncbi:MAG: L-lactate permease, partial [Chthoniobacterales bacterium]
MTDFFFAALPIVLLVYVMTKRRAMPSTVAFALAAAVAYGIQFLVFRTSFNLLNAAVIAGLLNALTPISIVFGAILFFVAMERSGAMDVLREWLRGISANPVAQLMVVGWSFQFLIEGSSGFGTPAALAAPMLVGLGFPPMRATVLCLVMNSIPVSFGAVGTPTWFGFGGLDLAPEQVLALGRKTAVLQTAASLLIPVIALRFVVGWSEIRANLVFIYGSILANVLPMLAVATVNDEFPSVIGGSVGLIVTILLARCRFGLARTRATDVDVPTGSLLTAPVLAALAPLIATIAILLITRVPWIGLRQWLTSDRPILEVSLGALGNLEISSSLVVGLRDILGEGLAWTHAVLYVPSIVPFVITGAFALVLFRSGGAAGAVVRETLHQIRRPVLALLGALVFVQILMVGGERASTLILGNALADAAGGGWIYLAPFLGALGSFFSGSATISNLTFGGIQYS